MARTNYTEATKRIVLDLDEEDFVAVIGAMKRRERLGRPHAAEGEPSTLFGTGDAILPDGGGNYAGRLIAEICRGWCEANGWDWLRGEPIDPDVDGRDTAGRIGPE